MPPTTRSKSKAPSVKATPRKPRSKKRQPSTPVPVSSPSTNPPPDAEENSGLEDEEPMDDEEEQAFVRMAQELMATSKKHREDRRKAQKKAFSASLAKLEEESKTLFQERDRELEILAKLDRLDALKIRRAEIENAIKEKLQLLNKAFHSATKAVSCVTEKRVREMEELDSRFNLGVIG